MRSAKTKSSRILYRRAHGMGAAARSAGSIRGGRGPRSGLPDILGMRRAARPNIREAAETPDGQCGDASTRHQEKPAAVELIQKTWQS